MVGNYRVTALVHTVPASASLSVSRSIVLRVLGVAPRREARVATDLALGVALPCLDLARVPAPCVRAAFLGGIRSLKQRGLAQRPCNTLIFALLVWLYECAKSDKR